MKIMLNNNNEVQITFITLIERLKTLQNLIQLN
jgi:hypothetical protein